jgi:hypothetical protein
MAGQRGRQAEVRPGHPDLFVMAGLDPAIQLINHTRLFA